MMVGRVKGGGKKASLAPREALLAGDVLRIGYEDESWHGVQRVGKYVPKHGRLYLKSKTGSGPGPEAGTPVFLVDRMEAALKEKMDGLGFQVSPKSGSSTGVRCQDEDAGRRAEGAKSGRAEERKSGRGEGRRPVKG